MKIEYQVLSFHLREDRIEGCIVDDTGGRVGCNLRNLLSLRITHRNTGDNTKEKEHY